MLDTCNNCFFLFPFHYCFFFSDIQIKEVDFKSQVLFFFSFHIPTILWLHPWPRSTSYRADSLFLLKIHKFSLLSRVVSTRKAFSVCWYWRWKALLGIFHYVYACMVWDKFFYCFKNKRTHYNAQIGSQWIAPLCSIILPTLHFITRGIILLSLSKHSDWKQTKPRSWQSPGSGRVVW